MKTELDSAWESAIHNAERARKAEAEIERLQAELAEAKKFKDGMLDVLGGACPKDHKATPFDDFKGCTPCLRAELAACKEDAERYRWLRDWAGRETITQLSHIEPDAWDAFVDGEMEESK